MTAVTPIKLSPYLRYCLQKCDKWTVLAAYSQTLYPDHAVVLLSKHSAASRVATSSAIERLMYSCVSPHANECIEYRAISYSCSLEDWRLEVQAATPVLQTIEYWILREEAGAEVWQWRWRYYKSKMKKGMKECCVVCGVCASCSIVPRLHLSKIIYVGGREV